MLSWHQMIPKQLVCLLSANSYLRIKVMLFLDSEQGGVGRNVKATFLGIQEAKKWHKHKCTLFSETTWTPNQNLTLLVMGFLTNISHRGRVEGGLQDPKLFSNSWALFLHSEPFLINKEMRKLISDLVVKDFKILLKLGRNLGI